MKRTVTIISEHTVASCREMELLIEQRDIRGYLPRNARHRTHWQIKHSPNRTYRGPWGQELVFWNGTDAAFVKTTQTRAQEIQQHICDLLFDD